MNDINNLMLVVQIGCCLLMTGVIIVIQFVHYPSFEFINASKFSSFHVFHSKTMGKIAGPLMILELVTAGVLLSNLQGVWILNFLLVVVLWLATFLLSVPQHRILEGGFNKSNWTKLVYTNWIRTAIWVGRSFFFLYFLFSNISLFRP